MAIDGPADSQSSMWSALPGSSIPATRPNWGRQQGSPSPATRDGSVETRSEDTRVDPPSDDRRPVSPVAPKRRRRSQQVGDPAYSLVRECEADIRTFTPQTEVSTAVLPPPPPSRPRGAPSVGTALALASTGGNRTAITGQLLELIGGDVSGSRGSRGNTTITSFVHNETPEPTSEYEYAHRIMQDVQHIAEPHVLLSVLKCVEKRIEDLRGKRR